MPPMRFSTNNTMKTVALIFGGVIALLVGYIALGNTTTKRDWSNSKIQIDVLLDDDNWYPTEVLALDSKYMEQGTRTSGPPEFRVDLTVADTGDYGEKFAMHSKFSAICMKFGSDQMHLVTEAKFDTPPSSGEWDAAFKCGEHSFRARTVPTSEARKFMDIVTICQDVDTDSKKAKLKPFCHKNLNG